MAARISCASSSKSSGSVLKNFQGFIYAPAIKKLATAAAIKTKNSAIPKDSSVPAIHPLPRSSSKTGPTKEVTHRKTPNDLISAANSPR